MVLDVLVKKSKLAERGTLSSSTTKKKIGGGDDGDDENSPKLDFKAREHRKLWPLKENRFSTNLWKNSLLAVSTTFPPPRPSLLPSLLVGSTKKMTLTGKPLSGFTFL
ncbi:unnamed protein product [Mucor hiemalis]